MLDAQIPNAKDAGQSRGLTQGSVADGRPPFLLTIDTEGDDLWSRPKEITTENLKFLPRFQSLCERYGFKPTYLTNWEAAIDPGYQEFARDVLARGAGEVGLHIHAWNSPPISPLTDDDFHHQPYLTEYPARVIEAKVRRLTGVLEETFERKMLSHRGGRWAFDDIYARILIANGYTVDCSVTPNVSWRRFPGAPDGCGGPDYTHALDAPHLVPVAAKPGEGQLLEAPVTILKRVRTPPERWLRKALNRTVDRVLWMWPNGRNLRDLFEVVDSVVAERRPYLEFALHSSELMPGGSPTFRTPRDIERLYDHFEALFSKVQVHFRGQTLCEFADAYRRDFGSRKVGARGSLEIERTRDRSAAGARNRPAVDAGSRSCSTFVPMFDACPAAENHSAPVETRAERRMRRLSRMADIGLSIAEKLERQAELAAVHAEVDAVPDNLPHSRRLDEIGRSFAQVSRAVSLATALEDRIDKGLPALPDDDRAVREREAREKRAEVARAVVDAIDADPTVRSRRRIVQLRLNLDRLLDAELADLDCFLRRPFPEIEARLRRDLGLQPDDDEVADPSVLGARASSSGSTRGPRRGRDARAPGEPRIARNGAAAPTPSAASP